MKLFPPKISRRQLVAGATAGALSATWVPRAPPQARGRAHWR